MAKDDIAICLFCGERFRSDCFSEHFKDATEPRPDSKSNCHGTYYLRDHGYKQSKTGYWYQ